MQTSFLGYQVPLREEVWGFRSGEYVDQEMSRNRETKHSGNMPLRKVIFFLAVWALMPF